MIGQILYYPSWFNHYIMYIAQVDIDLTTQNP